MKNSFAELGISPPILKAIEEMGFEEPTEVQARAIPHVLKKEDLIVMSKTGSGKTAVYGVSMLQLIDPAAPGPQGMILTPTRELAVQVDSDIKQLASHLEHKTAVLYGQHSMDAEIRDLKKGATIITGTPGRLYDHIQHGNLKTGNIRFLVLDEADRMLDMGFIDQIERIVRTLPKNRVTLLFSATIPPEVLRICSRHMKNPEMIEIESPTLTVDTIQQAYWRVDNHEKNTQLNRLLLYEQPESCLIFCNTRHAVDRVQSFLTRKGYASQALHGEIPQGRRIKTIEQFKQGKFHILVATDVAARGLQIDNLSLVINYDVPVERDSYVHRIGRTGRAGNSGRSITLVTSDDIMSLYEIEEHIGTLIAEAGPPSEAEFGKRAAEADRWVQANALKARPATGSQAATRRKDRQPRSKQGSNSKRPQTGSPLKNSAEKRDQPKLRDGTAKPDQPQLRDGTAKSDQPKLKNSAARPNQPKPYEKQGKKSTEEFPRKYKDFNDNPTSQVQRRRPPAASSHTAVRTPETGGDSIRRSDAATVHKKAGPQGQGLSQGQSSNQGQETSSKKTFLQRVLSRILNR